MLLKYVCDKCWPHWAKHNPLCVGKKQLSCTQLYTVWIKVQVSHFSTCISSDRIKQTYCNFDTGIHSYALNDRLFTESVNLNEDGKSVCPVCLISRKKPTTEDPAFVR